MNLKIFGKESFLNTSISTTSGECLLTHFYQMKFSYSETPPYNRLDLILGKVIY